MTLITHLHNRSCCVRSGSYVFGTLLPYWFQGFSCSCVFLFFTTTEQLFFFNYCWITSLVLFFFNVRTAARRHWEYLSRGISAAQLWRCIESLVKQREQGNRKSSIEERTGAAVRDSAAHLLLLQAHCATSQPHAAAFHCRGRKHRDKAVL